MSAFEPSLARRGLDLLLREHPFLDLVSLDWQLGRSPWIPAKEPSRPLHDGPWLLVELGQPSDDFERFPAWAIYRFAIFKRTGAVHVLGSDGAVGDDPILTP